MDIFIKRSYVQAIERIKANAITLKASCDAMTDLTEKDEKKVDEMEDFFEEAYELLAKYTKGTSNTEMFKEGVLVNRPSELDKHFNDFMKGLDILVKASRNDGELPAELLFTKIYTLGLFGKEDKK